MMRKQLVMSALLLLALLPHASLADDSDAIANATKDIVNFHSLPDGTVFRGGKPTEQGIEDLAALKVVAIIDLQGGDIHGKNPVFDLYNYIAEPGERKSSILSEKKEAELNGIKFYSKPLNSNDTITDAEAQTINEILDLLHEAQDQPVYVHCQHGKDRTGLIMALYAVKYLNVTPEAAHEQMVAYGHTGFLDHFFTGKMDDYFWKATR